jgi:hypothetical protein
LSLSFRLNQSQLTINEHCDGKATSFRRIPRVGQTQSDQLITHLSVFRSAIDAKDA